MTVTNEFRSRTKSLALSLIMAVGVVLSLSATYAAAQRFENEGTPEQRRACRSDVLRHCRGMHENYAIEQCLRANMSELRPACRHVFGGF
jgi:hypothetical protein